MSIDLSAARNATLRNVVAELPPSLVAQALGYSVKVIYLQAAHTATPTAGCVTDVSELAVSLVDCPEEVPLSPWRACLATPARKLQTWLARSTNN